MLSDSHHTIDNNQPLGSLSEHDIIALQAQLLHRGIHYSCTSTPMSAARTIIAHILTSLNYYHQPVLLSLNKNLTAPFAINLYPYLQEHNILDAPELESFFLEDFDGDFLLIEETNDLVTLPWYQQVQNTILGAGIADGMSIFILKG